MVAKSKTTGKGKGVKVGKLRVNKETVKDLTGKQTKQIKGGSGNCQTISVGCPTVGVSTRPNCH
jgi:hypothetical protein